MVTDFRGTHSGLFGDEYLLDCVWVEGDRRQYGTFHFKTLQLVEMDGEPRKFG